MFRGGCPQTHQVLFIWKQIRSALLKHHNTWDWYKCAGWKNLMATGMRRLTLCSRADRADYSHCCVKTLTTGQCCCQSWRGLLGVRWGVTNKNQHLYSIILMKEPRNKLMSFRSKDCDILFSINIKQLKENIALTSGSSWHVRILSFQQAHSPLYWFSESIWHSLSSYRRHWKKKQIFKMAKKKTALNCER